ncbi:MAG TPA: hypothetical protein VHV27_11635 [Phenylobacterium sp.]|jgi:hypothetical protein|nr:hypothetical protein [Phenylobacterium sp.]
MWKLLSPALAAALALVTPSLAATAGPRARPVAQNALDGVFAAFQRRPVVLLSDAHHLAQAGALYAALVRDPRFAREVGNVVVEFGGAAHQDTIDRFVNGESVPYVELRRVWTDLVGAETPASQMYSSFFAVVRQVNARLPPDRRIRVWLGEPPIDWTKLHSFDDLDPLMTQRDSYPAGLVDHDILARGRKALVIYGGAHFLFSPMGAGKDMRSMIERAHPGSTYLIVPYFGYAKGGCSQQVEARSWKSPALVAPIAGTWLAPMMRRCANATGFHSPDPARVAQFRIALSGASADALLYLGPSASLVWDAADPSLYLDPDFVAEWNRTRLCCLPPEAVKIDPDQVLGDNTGVPRSYPPQ